LIGSTGLATGPQRTSQTFVTALSAPVTVTSPPAVAPAALPSVSPALVTAGRGGSNADQPGAPELLPPPTESAAPGDRAAPPQTDGLADPTSDPAPAVLPGAGQETEQATDACFADDRWLRAASLKGAPTVINESRQDEGPRIDSAGLVLSLALGGTWAIATQQRKRLPRRPWEGR
jgi:hypothetical protein